MKGTRTYMVGLAAFGLAVSLTGSSQAAFTSAGKVTKSAVATLSGAGSVTMNVTVKKVSDNSASAGGAVNWSNVTLPTAWKLADDYIQLDSVLTAGNGGIQIYTDNMATDANPKFTGNPTVVSPAGLVDNTDTTKKLNMAWSIKDTVATAPGAADPNTGPTSGNSNKFQWLFMKDASDVAIPTSNVAAFANGDPFITTEQAGPTIHFGQDAAEFGAAASPNFIYFEADFSTAVTPRTYSTSKLTLEAFTQ